MKVVSGLILAIIGGVLTFGVAIVVVLGALIGAVNGVASGGSGSGSGGDGGGNPVPGPRPGHVIRVEQKNPAEYVSSAEYDVWSNSTCSAASMTAALRTLGYGDVRVTNVLARLGGNIDPFEGLHDPNALASVGQSYGIPSHFKEGATYDDLKTWSDAHYLVLVDIRNAGFPGGHWIMVSYTNDLGVQVTDPWPSNIQSFSKGDLETEWNGRTVWSHRVVVVETPFY